MTVQVLWSCFSTLLLAQCLPLDHKEINSNKLLLKFNTSLQLTVTICFQWALYLWRKLHWVFLLPPQLLWADCPLTRSSMETCSLVQCFYGVRWT